MTSKYKNAAALTLPRSSIPSTSASSSHRLNKAWSSSVGGSVHWGARSHGSVSDAQVWVEDKSGMESVIEPEEDLLGSRRPKHRKSTDAARPV